MKLFSLILVSSLCLVAHADSKVPYTLSCIKTEVKADVTWQVMVLSGGNLSTLEGHILKSTSEDQHDQAEGADVAIDNPQAFPTHDKKPSSVEAVIGKISKSHKSTWSEGMTVVINVVDPAQNPGVKSELVVKSADGTVVDDVKGFDCHWL